MLKGVHLYYGKGSVREERNTREIVRGRQKGKNKEGKKSGENVNSENHTNSTNVEKGGVRKAR